MVINIIVICAIFIVPAIFAYSKQRTYHAKLTYLMSKDDTWSFKGWAEPLTSMGTVLGLIVVLIQNNKNPLIAGINLICGAIIIILPTAYKALLDPKKTPVWAFLAFSTFTLWVVGAELGIAVMLADDDIIQTIPADMLQLSRYIIGVAALIVLLYWWRSITQLFEEHIDSSTQLETTQNLLTNIQNRLITPVSTLLKLPARSVGASAIKKG